MGCTKGDDGWFFMPFDLYIENFDNTSICVSADRSIYANNEFIVDMTQKNRAFYQFTLADNINTNRELLAFCTQ